MKKYAKWMVPVLCAMALLFGCSDPDTVATVDGRKISQSEFQAYLKFKRVPDQDSGRVERALDEYVRREALTAAIEKTERLDKHLMRVELEEFRRQMLIGRYFEDYLKESVSDEGVRNHYAKHADRYEAKSIRVSHILLRVDPRMSETERQEKLTRAHEAFSRVQAGEDFAKIAKSYSEDKVSSQKGGDLGWLREGAVNPEFSRRLFAMQPGDVSEPFLTPFGFHVAKVVEGPQVIKRPLEAVEGEIRYQLRNEAKMAETERLLAGIKIKRKDKK